MTIPEENQNAPTVGHSDPVLIYDAPTEEEAEVVAATLQAAGIAAVLQNPNLSAGAGMFAEQVGDTWRNGVFVPSSQVDEARAILNAPAPSEAELIAEEEADPTTTEEAEARIKDA